MYEQLKSLGKHFAVYGVGRILSRIVSFVLLPIYTHYLTAGEYGTLELLELTTYIVMMFVAGGISHAVMRFYYDSDDEREKMRVVSTALISIWVSSLFFLIWLLLFASEISYAILESTEFTGLFRLMFVSMVISLTNEIPLSFIRAQQKSTLFTAISVVQLVIALSLNILFIVGFDWGIRGIILSGITSQAVSGVFLGIYTFRYSGFGYSLTRAKQLLRYGLPLIPAGLGYFALNFADRFFLQRFSDLTQVGIYALGYKFGMVISPMVAEPFLSIYRPKMFELARNNREEAREFVGLVFTYLAFINLFMTLGISILIKDAILILSDPEFREAYQVVPLIGLAYVSFAAYSVIQIGILITKKTKYIAYMVISSAVLSLILNYLLIPPYGMWGAAAATIASYFSLFLMNYFLSFKLFRINLEFVRLFKLLVAAVALYLIALYINIESLALVLTVKFLLGLSYPLLLYFLGFYSSREKDKVREIVSRFRGSSTDPAESSAEENQADAAGKSSK